MSNKRKAKPEDEFDVGTGFPITNHEAWLAHFHCGRYGTPLTVYRMADGSFEVWYGKQKKIGLTLDRAATLLGNLILRHRGQVQL